MEIDIEKIKFDERGLVPAIVQEESGQVLMLAYMNAESLQKTVETGYTHFYSRSRQKLWKKGEESGNVQQVKALYYDCDGDTILVKVHQTGVACHTGSYSCFSGRRLDANKIFLQLSNSRHRIILRLFCMNCIRSLKTGNATRSKVLTQIIFSARDRIKF